ncbi:superoxide dismutase [Cu-Zn]-like isoform X3 [Scyliorhinus canicula]|uniref:superoxide dismutase [Cu-Zn]-like isoform X3 n=1 Tax=Scyliorhinus canicula TaxID=7830 RepID=UPI0018F5EE16|nr:superoxide dismutase [Cu-Zn]-like isoform X3 [Scyliorhinus canicula]
MCACKRGIYWTASWKAWPSHSQFWRPNHGWISAGPYYNPDNETPGAQEENKRHAGDLGTLEVNEDGLAKLDFTVQHFHLTGIHSIIGRSLVIHQNEDDIGKGGKWQTSSRHL